MLTLTSACTSIYPQSLQGRPNTLEQLATAKNTDPTLKADLTTNLSTWTDNYTNLPVNDPQRTVYRNKIMYARLRGDDKNFSDLEWTAWTATSGVSISSDWALLTVTGIGSVETKAAAALSAAAAGITGAKTSLEKNALYGQTLPALLVSMEVNRAQIRAHILTCLQQPDTLYPLQAAMYDEFQYVQAGVLPSTIARLTVNSVMPSIPAACGGAIGVANAPDVRTSLVKSLSGLGASDEAMLESVMNLNGLKPTTAAADSATKLSDDVNQIKQWMMTTSDDKVGQFASALNASQTPPPAAAMTPAQIRADTVKIIASYPAATVATLEKAMNSVGIKPTTPGSLSSDQTQIQTWLQAAVDADVAKLHTALTSNG